MSTLYSLRKSFSVIGLTGRMGNGCSQIADILSMPNSDFFSKECNPNLRNPEELSFSDSPNQGENVFIRKYTICHKYLVKNRKQYRVIDYKKVVLLYAINYIIRNNKGDVFSLFVDRIAREFEPSSTDPNILRDIKINQEELGPIVNRTRFEAIELQLRSLISDLHKTKEEKDFEKMYKIFFDDNGHFQTICNDILVFLKNKNIYLRTFLFHWLTNNIRSSGNPFNQADNQNPDNLFIIAKLINKLIKSYKLFNEDNCHIAIDSLKNSLEMMFFKERYSAFYIIAVHSENSKDNLEKKINMDSYSKITLDALISLDETEYKANDFKKGIFSAPDLQNCIQKSDIHILNRVLDKNSYDFYSTSEQLMKFQSLIFQPGIITPSGMERCMQIAYNSKLSSGCISRQVGAVITDNTYSIKAVGWNDTPKGSTPCLLRNIEQVIGNVRILDKDETYSPYETEDRPEFRYKINIKDATVGDNFKEVKEVIMNAQYADKSFVTNVTTFYQGKLDTITQQGKNCSFCFKTLQNTFEGEQNQVHTRSLHAEENAMLQITKYGGQPLEKGILFTTASPCELCSKKAYQLGITKIIYIDPYPGISLFHVLRNGFNEPQVEAFRGVIGKSFTKLYEPFISYKDEISLMLRMEL